MHDLVLGLQCEDSGDPDSTALPNLGSSSEVAERGNPAKIEPELDLQPGMLPLTMIIACHGELTKACSFIVNVMHVLMLLCMHAPFGSTWL